jgi:hypothetical protein
MPCQQDDVYAAERVLEPSPTFESFDAVQAFVDEMRDKYPFWEKAYAHVERIEIGPADRRGNAHVGWFEPDKCRGRCEFLTDRPEIQLVLHEITHVLASARYGSRAHDPWFARSYLELTYLVRGSMAYFDLYSAFIAYGVDFDAEGLT